MNDVVYHIVQKGSKDRFLVSPDANYFESEEDAQFYISEVLNSNIEWEIINSPVNDLTEEELKHAREIGAL